MQDMQNALIRLVAYGRNTDLLPEEDEIYTVNRLLELFEIDELQGELSVHEQIEEARKETSVEDLEEILKELPEVDGVLGTGSYYDVANAVGQVLSGKRYKQGL
mgnify:FL=1